MTVTGGKQVTAAFRRMPARVRERVEQAIEDTADQILADMKRMAPRDTGQLAAALTRSIEEGGLSARVGLPTDALASDFFYARFIELGTKGGEKTYRNRRSGKRVSVTVPAQPARPFMAPALDINRDDLIAAIREAVRQGMRGA